MIEVLCPECHAVLGDIDVSYTHYMRWPLLSCPCGFEGPVEWVNPSLPGTLTLEEERNLLEQQKTIARKQGRLSGSPGQLMSFPQLFDDDSTDNPPREA